jgi:hypothetical protein
MVTKPNVELPRHITVLNVRENCIQYYSRKVKAMCTKNLLATINVDLKVIDQILIRFSCFDRYWRKTRGRPTARQYINSLQTSRQRMFWLGRNYCTVFSLCIADPWQITMAARSEAWTVFAPSNAGIVVSNPTQDMDVCIVCVYSVFVLFCV